MTDLESLASSGSSQSTPSINSIDSEANNDVQRYVPEDGASVSSRNRLTLTRTETVKTLQDLGLTSSAALPDINAPVSSSKPAIFPEEYTLETMTGLVPVATLHSLGRTSTSISRTRTRQIEGTLSRRSTRMSTSKEESPEEYGDFDEEEEEGYPEGDLEKEGEVVPEIDPEIQFVTFVTNDPENPHNWSLVRRWYYTVVLSTLVICAAYGSSGITGGLDTVQKRYNVSLETATLACSLMVFGFMCGPLIWSPVSDIFGRRVAYFVSQGIYVLLNIPSALSPSLGGMLAARFFCGVCASSALCLVGGSLADMFPSSSRGKAIAFFAWAPYAGPCLGPLVNGFVSVSTDSMKLIYWINMAFCGTMWLLVAMIPETYAPVILRKRAKKLREQTGNPKIMTEQEAQGISISEMMKACLIRPLYFACTEVVLDMMCGYVCLIYSLLYAFFFAFPVIFAELYDYGDNYIGLMMIPILIGACFALIFTFWCESMYTKLLKRRKPTPEDRLLGAMIGAPWAAIALWILGATSYKHIIWVGPASSGIAFGFGMVLIYYSLNNYIIDCYVQYASSALATKVFLRSAGGAAFPLFTTQMYHNLGLQWASWLLAFICTGMIAIPYGFYYYGHSWRHKLSKKDYSIDTIEG